MIDQIIPRLKEEVAIDGATGNNMICTPPALDERYKAFLWEHLKTAQDLEFYEADHPHNETTSKTKPRTSKTKASTTKKSASSSKKKKQQPKKKKKTFRGGSDDDFDPDFDPDASAEEDNDNDDDDEELDFDDEEEDEPKKKKKKTSTPSPRLQKEQLLYGIPPGNTLSPNLIVLLQEIIKTRTKGLYQASITKLLDIDSRSTGHYCKSLEEKGAITRIPVAINAMRTNICIHARFQASKGVLDMNNIGDESEKALEKPFNVNADGKVFTEDTLLEMLVLLAKDAPDHAILSEELLRACGFDLNNKSVRKWSNRTIEILEIKGYVKKTNVTMPDNPRKIYRCLQLLKIPQAMSKPTNEPMTTKIEFPLKINSTTTTTTITTMPTTPGNVGFHHLHFLFDKPLEDQIYQAIEAAGDVGITQKEIAVVLNIFEGRVLYKALDKMCECTAPAKYTLGRVMEFEGKIKRFRYYSYMNYKKVVEQQTEIDPPPVLPPHAIPLPKKSGKSRGRPRKTPASSTAAASAVGTLKKNTRRSFLPIEVLKAQMAQTDSPAEAATATTEPTPKRMTAATDVPRTQKRQSENDSSNAANTPLAPSRPSKKAKSASTAVASNQAPTSKAKNKISYYFRSTKTRAEDQPEKEALLSASSTPVTRSRESTPAIPSPSPLLPKTADNASIDTNSSPQEQQALTTPSIPMDMDKEAIAEDEPADVSASIDVAPSQAADTNSTALVLAGPTTVSTTSTPAVSSVVIANGIKKYSHLTAKPSNIYLEKRIEVFLSILQDRSILEIDKSFRRLYDAKAAAIFPENFQNKTQVDMRTLRRTAAEIAKRNLATVTTIEYPLLNGRSKTKTLLVRSDIDIQGEQYKKFVGYLKELKAYHDPAVIWRRYDKAQFTVEPLQDRLERMQRQVEQLQEEGEINKARDLEAQIEKWKKNLNTFKESSRAKGSTYWLIQAMQYGWLNAPMMRAKALHQHILRLIEQHVNGTDAEERTIYLKTIVNYMTVELICQTIGIFNPTEQVKAFLQVPQNSDVLVKDLSKELKRQILSEQNKFRRRLRSIMNMLVYIKVLTPLRGDFFDANETVQNVSVNYIMLAERYKLNSQVPILNRKRKGTPVLHTLTIKNNDDYMDFWRELQYACTGNGLTVLPSEEQAPEPTDPLELIMHRTMHNLKNWSKKAIFSREQRKILNSYLDKSSLTTPVNNPKLMRHIAAETELGYDEVYYYYEKVQNAFDLKLKTNEVKKFAREIKRRNPPEKTVYKGRVVGLNSSRAFRLNRDRNPILNAGCEIVVDNQTRNQINKDLEERFKDELEYYDKMTELPVIEDPEDSGYNLNRKRRKRTIWSAHENDLLIYAYTILQSRFTKRKRYLWVSIQQLFPDKTPNAARNHLMQLLAFTYYAEMLESCKRLWPTIYKSGIRSGELIDNDPEDNINIDLLEFVTFFIQKLAELNSGNSAQTKLPKTVTMLKSGFTIAYTSEKTVIHDMYHSSGSMAGRLRALQSESITLQKYHNDIYDVPETATLKENDQDSRLRRLIRTVALMCLMTPEEVYDPFYCFSIIKSFPEKVFADTMDSMNVEGSLRRKGQSRRIPTTTLCLSEMFVRSMVGQLPENFFLQAKDYTIFLSRHEVKTRYTPEYVSSGMMASLLASFSNYQLNLYMANKKARLEELKQNVLRTRQIDRKSLEFEIDIEGIQDRDQVMPYIPDPERINLRLMSKEEFDTAFTTFVSHEKDGHFTDLIGKLVSALYDAGEKGLTGYQLNIYLFNDAGATGPYTEEDILTAINSLCSNQPSLVCRVGFDSVRYVHALFIDQWALVTKNMPHQEVAQAVREQTLTSDVASIDKAISAIRKEVIIPNLWTDINGNTTNVVLTGCKEVIVDLVLRKPGITEADILRHFGSALGRREIMELLVMLVRQQVLRQVSVIKATGPCSKKKPSLFDRKRAHIVKSKTLLTDTTQTCYWVTSNIFSNLAVNC
ncbi:hypothetical protein BDF20DRAFT_919544 [Mycotypha africana]|uniref:uncharacterized protein n=1 Tax=Mycotypha africana TaxID=64632 RepID=UPI002300F602|nr:uncharacterized protein BDF20DRAFT_919544 [Mycotypha africana]KAI8991207.1 hypothetical protein BDF20DRAFT_919544 [Mycotypha africana]